MTVIDVSFNEVLNLRHSILKPFADIKECFYPGDDCPTSFHLAVQFEGEIRTIASFHKEACPNLESQFPYRLRGMATTIECRNYGFGSLVLNHAFKKICDRQGDLLWCKAREVAFGFYEKLGLTYEGDFFDIPQIGPHKVMYRRF